MENSRFEKHSFVVVDEIAPAYPGHKNLLSVSLLEGDSIEQFPCTHAFLPVVQDHIPGSIAVRQYYCRMVGADAVACVTVDACAKRLGSTGLQVYLEAFDVWGLTIVSEQASYVLFFVAVDACDLFVPILVSEEWLRDASAK